MEQMQIDTLKEMKLYAWYYTFSQKYYEFFDKLVELGFCEKKIFYNRNIYRKIKDL